MKWFYDLKIGTKLISSFVLVAAIAAFIGYEGMTSLTDVSEGSTALYESYTVPLAQMGDITQYFQRVRLNTRDVILENTPSGIEGKITRIQEHRANIDKISGEFEKSIVSAEMKEMFAEFLKCRKEYGYHLDELITLARQNKDAEAFKLLQGDMAKSSSNEQAIIVKMMDAKVTAAKNKSLDNSTHAETAQTMMLIVVLAGAFIAIGLGIFISRIISKPLQAGVEMMKELSQGHIDARLNMTTKDEIGVLAQTMDEFAGKLQTKVVAVMDRIATGNLTDEVDVSDKKDAISPALKQIIDSLRNLNAEAKRLTEAALAGKLATRGDVTKYQGAYKEIVQGVNDTLDAVIGPLNVAAEYVDRIAKGDIPAKITDNYNGDFNEIKNNLNMAIDAVNNLVKDAAMLSKAAVEGKLATRADASKHHGDYQKIVQGVNDTLDSVIRPLNVAAEYVDRISKGDIPNRITDSYNGDFNEIKNNLNTCIDSLNGLIAEMNTMSKQHDLGEIDAKIDSSKFQGAYAQMGQGVNDMVFGHIAVKKKAMACVAEFGNGNFEAPLEKFPGKKVFINNTIEQVRTNLKALITDADMLAKAAVEGKLATRADASKHQGDFRKIVQGVNDTLDSVIRPLNVAAEYVDRISKGDIPNKITDNYNGDFNEIKNNLNTCIDALNGLITEMNTMSTQHDLGDIDVKIDSAKFQGAYHLMAKGVNDMVFGHIAVKKKAMGCISEFGKGNFDAELERFPGKKVFINNTIEQVRDNLKALIADANMLVVAAVEGRLNTRADATKHLGDFRKIVQGVNDTLDSVIVPVQEGTKILARMAEGDMTVRVNSDYKGDHQLLKNSINTVAENLDKALQDVTNAVSATASASSQISSSTEEMAAGSQEQSSQANEVASAVEQMTKTIIDNSRNASTAAETAKKAKEAAGQGGKVVDETISGMKRIAEVVNVSAETVKALGKSSEQIGEIIAVIDDIADQTNLLALNAAIEAARAGEQGRGFAVVADEVRKLAERTTKATKEIASMIKQIQSDTSGAVTSMNEGTTEVSKGIKLADKAGESLSEIVNISQTVTDMITQIATASEEQSSTSEQISKNVEAISTVTSETASGTQQVARAAEDLNRLTENLQQLISKFKISTDGGAGQYRNAPKTMKEEKGRTAVKQNGHLVAHD